jgi:hypothetical protein
MRELAEAVPGLELTLIRLGQPPSDTVVVVLILTRHYVDTPGTNNLAFIVGSSLRLDKSVSETRHQLSELALGFTSRSPRSSRLGAKLTLLVAKLGSQACRP